MAVCLAGAFRQFNFTWLSIELNLVRPARAAVFVTTSADGNETSGHPGHEVETWSKLDLHRKIGVPLRGIAAWDTAMEKDRHSISAWAGINAANASQVSHLSKWYLKRWTCNQLVAHDPAGPYDIIVTMRPDLFLYQPWRFTRTEIGNFSLQVGTQTAVQFGDGKVVMNDFTMLCANDWVSVATRRDATTIEQMVHHIYSANAFMPCLGGVNKAGEFTMGSWLWRIGLARHIYALHVDLVRTVSYAFKVETNRTLRSEASQIRYLQTQRLFDGRRNAAANRPSWQRYCRDASFEEYADGYMLEDDSRSSWPRNKSLPNPGLYNPVPLVHENASVPSVYIPRNHGGFFPVCEDVVDDLMQPLPSCIRLRSSQRIQVSRGQGRSFAVACGEAGEATCQPVPGVSFVSNGSLVPAIIFARQQGSHHHHLLQLHQPYYGSIAIS